MKMKKLSIAIAAIMISGGASAQWAVVDANAYRGLQAVVDAVRGNGQVSSQIQAKAAENMANAVADTAATEANRRAERDYQIQDACGAIAGTRGLSDASRVVDPKVARSGRGSGGSARLAGRPNGASVAMNNAIDVASGATATPSPEVQAALALEGACETFVDPASVRGQACIAAGRRNTGARGEIEPNSDIKAATLFKGALRPNEPVRTKLTINPDDREPEWYSLQALRRNLFSPIELRALSSGELQTNPGKQYMALRDSYEARVSLASAPLQNFIENRSANAANAGMVDQLLNTPVHASYVTAYIDANKLTNWRARGISNDEAMQLEVERRYMNLDWHRSIASQPGDPISKEMIVMAAQDKVMMWRLIQHVAQMNVMLGQISGTLNRMEMTPQLNALHSAAAGASR